MKFLSVLESVWRAKASFLPRYCNQLIIGYNQLFGSFGRALLVQISRYNCVSSFGPVGNLCCGLNVRKKAPLLDEGAGISMPLVQNKRFLKGIGWGSIPETRLEW